MMHKKLIKQNSNEWLNARTLHISGIPAEDRAGNGLKLVIDKFLSDYVGCG
jgi:hypothetical protein